MHSPLSLHFGEDARSPYTFPAVSPSPAYITGSKRGGTMTSVVTNSTTPRSERYLNVECSTHLPSIKVGHAKSHLGLNKDISNTWMKEFEESLGGVGALGHEESLGWEGNSVGCFFLHLHTFLCHPHKFFVLQKYPFQYSGLHNLEVFI